MTKEIEYSQTAVSREEDQILALMVEFEQLELDLESAETVLREDEKTVRAERSSLEDLNAQDQKTLDAYREERQDLERQIDDDVLSRYEKVRRLRGGIAMAPAVDEACEICKVRMRPQSFQEVRKNEGIITCDSCGRILYDPENLDHPFEVA
jgi:predicted  nucleic acid-binding Zn-ribbon protein